MWLLLLGGVNGLVFVQELEQFIQLGVVLKLVSWPASSRIAEEIFRHHFNELFTRHITGVMSAEDLFHCARKRIHDDRIDRLGVTVTDLASYQLNWELRYHTIRYRHTDRRVHRVLMAINGRPKFQFLRGRIDSINPPDGVANLHQQTSNVEIDRKSTRLNSSHVKISYAVFCLKKKNRPPTT